MPFGRLGLMLVVVLAFAGPAAGEREAEEVRPRVEHHVRHAEELATHLETQLQGGCPRFPSFAAWEAYVDAEVGRLILLVAHVEQAWTEAKTTGNDEVRQAAKVPRRRLNEARALVDKWQLCAQENGTTLEMGSIARRIEREVPRRRAEIALP